jgi:hypothetical protein
MLGSVGKYELDVGTFVGEGFAELVACYSESTAVMGG